MTAKMKPLDRKTLAVLAKKFADVVPEEEFSVAGLQGCKLFLFIYIIIVKKRKVIYDFRRFIET